MDPTELAAFACECRGICSARVLCQAKGRQLAIVELLFLSYLDGGEAPVALGFKV